MARPADRARLRFCTILLDEPLRLCGVRRCFERKCADGSGTAGGGSYVPAGMSKAEYDRIQKEAEAKKAASRGKKRGSNMSLDEAQRTGYKTFVSLKGDATQKQAKKGWLNPFSDE